MMNIRSFRHHFKEGIKGLFKNRRMSIASIVSVIICITMLITSLCTAINLDSSLENLEKNIGISLYLGEVVTTEQIRELVEELDKVENISNITYNSKDDALEWAKEQWGEENIILSGLDKDNPFPRSIDIEINGIKNQDTVLEEVEKIQKNFEIKLLTAMELEQIKLDISLGVANLEDDESLEEVEMPEDNEGLKEVEISEDNEGLEEVETSEETSNLDENSSTLEEDVTEIVLSKVNSKGYEYIGIEKISHTKTEADILMSLSTTIRIVSIILIVALAIISVIIIFNTIKITVYVRREEINIMKYIGASNSFIRWPFVIEGVLIGVIGAVISIAVCFFLYLKVDSIILNNAYLNTLIILKKPIYLFLVISPISLILGVLLGAIGSINSIKKHLDV